MVTLDSVAKWCVDQLKQTEAADGASGQTNQASGSKTTPKKDAPLEWPPIELGERRDTVTVLGSVKSPLTPAQYDVVKALLAAGLEGLTSRGLDRASHRTDSRKILERIANSDAGWAAVIRFSGSEKQRYRIVCP